MKGGGTLKITVKGTPREIAALLKSVEIRERQVKMMKVNLKIDGKTLAETTIRDTASDKQG